jgi:hypothetical protein
VRDTGGRGRRKKKVGFFLRSGDVVYLEIVRELLPGGWMDGWMERKTAPC